MARRSGILGGIIALILAFFYELPIYPPNNWVINLKIFTLGNVDHYFWGYLINDSDAYTLITMKAPENLLPLSIWIIIFYIGLSSIMASTTKAKITNSLKLYRVNIILTILILIIYGFIIFMISSQDFTQFLSFVGLGYYLTILVLLLNIIALLYTTSK